MDIYIKNQEGTSLVEKGEILTIGGTKRDMVLTGNDILKLNMIGKYKNKKEAEEIFDFIVGRIVSPTATEVEKGIIFIDLNKIEELNNN